MTQVLFFLKKTSVTWNIVFEFSEQVDFAIVTSSKNVKTQKRDFSFTIGCLLQFPKHFSVVIFNLEGETSKLLDSKMSFNIQ